MPQMSPVLRTAAPRDFAIAPQPAATSATAPRLWVQVRWLARKMSRSGASAKTAQASTSGVTADDALTLPAAIRTSGRQGAMASAAQATATPAMR